ncbi:alpha/beta fold hydrolase [Nocardia australiensis]|uniref:alpha/beta fold hydrolase n=1 Tax=Nocardia australiensis TaxID=2887191 RepID=UPI001D15E1C0|nr:alpha/beta hydrolase [Nocardia australiensis]
METVTSADGTVIAFDRLVGGDAGTVILIGGAFGFRKFSKMVELAETLADKYGLTVINYDRRGRGDSTDTPGVYNADNEIDDIAALIQAAGGSAALFGWSSGAALALRAGESGRVSGITRIVAFEPPFIVDHEGHVPPADLHIRLHELVAADRRAETARFYMTKAIGIPAFFVSIMRFTPFWKDTLANANSTPHDWAVMAEFMRGEAIRAQDWSNIDVPVLVISGAKSGALLRKGANAIATVIPHAEHRELAKLSHNPNVAILAPAAGEFLTRSRTTA